MPYDYDLLVIGSGPGGQKAAIQAAKLGKRVAIVDRREMVGGVCTNTGTIPSKTLREAVLYLTGMSERGIYGQSYRVEEEISSQEVFHRTQHVVQREIDIVRAQLARNHVALLNGHARFIDPHTLCVTAAFGEERRASAARIVIAVGTHPAKPPTVEFDGHRVPLVRRRPEPRLAAELAPRGRRRRDRHRVRLDVRRARLQGDGRRAAAPPP
jgi:NAD(P) transhydrogenase